MASARLNCLPKIVLDDPKVGRFDHDPFAFGIEDARSSPCRWIFDEATSVEHKPAAIEVLAENAIAGANVAIQRGDAPRPAAWRGDALGVERLHEFQRRHAGRIRRIYAPHDCGFLVVDIPVAALFACDDAISVATSAGAPA
ncbi:MAG TPA: hypothetical protein DHW63_07070 [Hyphomonadaceae bacterium]|nr:hypothetical protein [Hyphomonadaceae bacterium]